MATYEGRNAGWLVDAGLMEESGTGDHDPKPAGLEKFDSATHSSEENRLRSRNGSHDDPFEDGSVEYKTMSWWQGAVIMIAETISIGILSLPSALATIGIVPGIILIISLGVIATYTGYVIFQFKKAHPHVLNLADAGEVLCGPIGREVFGASLVILLIFTSASHILTFTIALNVITQHATCTIVWSVVALAVFIVCCLPRTMKAVSYLSIAAFISIITAIMIAMIGLGVGNPQPIQAAASELSLASAFIPVANIVFAYGGHASFFSFITEFRDVDDFPKALYCLQAFDTCFYVIVAVVVYIYAGTNVSSPALGSLPTTLSRIAYGVSLPTIIIAGVIYTHVAAKYVYVRIFRGTHHMSTNSFLAVGTWIAIIVVLWVIAFVIAESIPTFNDLLALISSLFSSWFSYGFSGIMWLYLNRGQWFKGWRKICLSILNFAIILIGAAICGLGLYASGVAIKADSGSSASWSCADNSS